MADRWTSKPHQHEADHQKRNLRDRGQRLDQATRNRKNCQLRIAAPNAHATMAVIPYQPNALGLGQPGAARRSGGHVPCAKNMSEKITRAAAACIAGLVRRRASTRPSRCRSSRTERGQSSRCRSAGSPSPASDGAQAVGGGNERWLAEPDAGVAHRQGPQQVPPHLRQLLTVNQANVHDRQIEVATLKQVALGGVALRRQQRPARSDGDDARARARTDGEPGSPEAASGCWSATATLSSSGQPAVSSAMTATLIPSQRNPRLRRADSGTLRRLVGGHKRLTQAVGAAAKDDNDERCHGDDDDGHGDQPQVSR